ncbi:MAG: hypothetical protein ACI82S_001955 [Patiriisocius sp.]|jgi:hypothetical protein
MTSISIQKAPLKLTDLVHSPTFGEPIGDLPVQTESCFYNQDGVIMGT